MPRRIYTAEDVWARVDKHGPDECWPWAGACFTHGYGAARYRGATWVVHRLVWTLTHGPIPPGLFVCHTCDNPPCCNPAHLWLGTIADNNADKVRKGRANTPRGERHGEHTHPERVARGERHGSRTHPESRPRGERHWTHMHPEYLAWRERSDHTKLTANHVLAIRRVYAKGEYKQHQIACVLGVSAVTISHIVTGKTWRRLLAS
jgi:predicted XRE-type DNA-binding protein